MSNDLIVLGEFNGVEIHARESDKYVDVTELCQTHGKDLYEYRRSAGATRFLDAVSRSTGISPAELVIVGQGGAYGKNTLADRIALHCASWISAEFEVWCTTRSRSTRGRKTATSTRRRRARRTAKSGTITRRRRAPAPEKPGLAQTTS